MNDQAAQSDSPAPSVTVRYWASAKAAAGVASETVEAPDLAALIAEIERRHTDRDRFSDVIDTCSILIGETPVGARDHTGVVFSGGEHVEFLPPFAGG